MDEACRLKTDVDTDIQYFGGQLTIQDRNKSLYSHLLLPDFQYIDLKICDTNPVEH